MEKYKKIIYFIAMIIIFVVVVYETFNANIDIDNNLGENQETSIETDSNLNEPKEESTLINNLETVEETTNSVSSELKVYFFDVGQGDSIFVQNGEYCMLIDAGNNPDGKYISKYLRKTLGISKIDYLIGTHAHEDHIGGTDIIIEDFDIGTFYMPDTTSNIKSYNDVLDWAKKKDLKVTSPDVGTKFNLGEAKCEVMAKMDNREEENENSIVIEVTFGNEKFLFTSDMENVNEDTRNWNDVDVLKVAHHGSTYTNSAKFLKEVKPEIAVVTCGKNNDYYYPHEAVLKRLNQVGCKDIYVTADEGTILITSDGNSNKVECFKDLSFDGNL